LGVLVTACTALAACTASPVAPQSGGTTATPAAGAEAVVAAAQAELDRYSGLPTFTPPNEAFDVSGLAGRRIAIVAVNQTTPALVYVAEGVQQAAEAVGMTTTLFDAKNTPSLMTAGVQQAIAARADAIVLDGIPVELVANQLAEAAAAKIPVVNADNSQPDPSQPGQGAGENIYASAAPDFALQGRLAADAAIVRTGGAAKAVLVTTDGITPAAAVMKGFTDGLGKCPTCTVLDTRSVQLQDWSTKLGSLTTSILAAHPDANVIMPIYVTMALFMLPAVQQANASGKVSMFSTSGVPDGAKLLITNPTLGGLAGCSEFAIGWLAVNQSMRGMLGLAPGDPTVPTRFLTAAIVQQSGTSEPEMYGDAHEAGFKKLWGIGV
jgi:ribose transport system substrate-binding protein